MSDDNPSRVLRNALIATIVAIVMNPLSVILGYYLNQRLRNAKISMEYISDTYNYESHTLNPDTFRGLTADDDLIANLRDTLTKVAAARGTEQCVDWLDDSSAWEDRCIPIVREVANGITSALKAQESAPRATYIFKLSKSDTNRKLAVLGSLLLDLKKMDDTPETKRTVSFPVAVLNTGDADEVIYNRAALRFEGKELWLYSDSYTVAKASSFQEIEFKIPDNDQDEVALKRWKELVNARTLSPFEIIIKTGKGSIPKTGTLHP